MMKTKSFQITARDEAEVLARVDAGHASNCSDWFRRAMLEKLARDPRPEVPE